MIDVKKAVRIAFDCCKEFHQGNYRNRFLEEVEISDNEEYWFITLGYEIPNVSTILSKQNWPIKQKSNRKYKIFKINAKDGKIISMKIRKV